MTNAQELAVRDWAGFIGQNRMKERLSIHTAAALHDNRPLEHVMLSGPLGSGKSTMANLLSKRLAGPSGRPEPLLSLTMPMTRKSIIDELDSFGGGILFLDEIHALAKKDQELFLPLLTEGYVEDERGRQHYTSWLSVVAATTERDKVLKTLLSRFHIRPEFEPYTDDELGRIVASMARMIELPLDEETALALGRASGGIPRNAEHMVLAARALRTVGRPLTADSILEFMVIDEDGLTELHVRYLHLLLSQKGKAGLSTIVMMLQLPPEAVRELERLLVERGLIIFTPAGRELTIEGRLKAQGSEVVEYVRR